jgi:hypothetical protein
MPFRKLRGHNRIRKQISRWAARNCNADLQEYLRFIRDRSYVKIAIHPYNGLHMNRAQIKQPHGANRQLMLAGLIAVYDSWKKQLDAMNQPYYLQIWLYEPHFVQSQVVCATGESLHFYADTFPTADSGRRFMYEQYGKLAEQLRAFQWQQKVHEHILFDNEIGEPEDYASKTEYLSMKSSFEAMLKKPHRTTSLSEGLAAREAYGFTCGRVWVGNK